MEPTWLTERRDSPSTPIKIIVPTKPFEKNMRHKLLEKDLRAIVRDAFGGRIELKPGEKATVLVGHEIRYVHDERDPPGVMTRAYVPVYRTVCG